MKVFAPRPAGGDHRVRRWLVVDGERLLCRTEGQPRGPRGGVHDGDRRQPLCHVVRVPRTDLCSDAGEVAVEQHGYAVLGGVPGCRDRQRAGGTRKGSVCATAILPSARVTTTLTHTF